MKSARIRNEEKKSNFTESFKGHAKKIYQEEIQKKKNLLEARSKICISVHIAFKLDNIFADILTH